MTTPYWTSPDGQHVLYCGDCLEVLQEIGTVDSVITDPPYGIKLRNTARAGAKHGLRHTAYTSDQDTYENFVASVVPRLNTALQKTTRGAVFTGPHIHEQRKPDALGGIYCSTGSGRHCWGFKQFLPVLLYGSAPDLHKGASTPTVIVSNAMADDCGHPCPKPIPWMVWLLLLASRQYDTILDPFAGSCTTGVACIRTGRRFLGIEIDEGYCAIGVKRMEEELRQPQLFLPSRSPQPTQKGLF